MMRPWQSAPGPQRPCDDLGRNGPFKRLMAQEAFVIGHAWHPRLNSFHAQRVFLKEKAPERENASAQRFPRHRAQYRLAPRLGYNRCIVYSTSEASSDSVSGFLLRSRSLGDCVALVFTRAPDGTSPFKFLHAAYCDLDCVLAASLRLS
jgi:hypothetical protein